jgi:heme/copper-type cytochrome/quinol oxidase subunit 2
MGQAAPGDDHHGPPRTVMPQAPPPASSQSGPSDKQEGLVSIYYTEETSRRSFVGACLAAITALASGVPLRAQTRRDFTVTARRYAFEVAGSGSPEIRVMQNDLVHITFSADDIPHSFTIEEAPYRIMRRAEPGKPVVFSFRADQAGRFRFYCNLTADERCREMTGTLVVAPSR